MNKIYKIISVITLYFLIHGIIFGFDKGVIKKGEFKYSYTDNKYYYVEYDNNSDGSDLLNTEVELETGKDNEYFGYRITYNSDSGYYEYEEIDKNIVQKNDKIISDIEDKKIIVLKDDVRNEEKKIISDKKIDNKDLLVINDKSEESNSSDKKENKSDDDLFVTQGLLKYGKTPFYPFHVGVDIRSKYQSLYSWKDNLKVIKVEKDQYLGNYIILSHGNELFLLAHLNKFNINEGDVLKKGTLIGESGNSGNSLGPHLHVELYVDGILQGDKVVKEELKCIHDTKCSHVGYNKKDISKTRFRDILKENGKYKDTYDNFFKKLESISIKNNVPERNLFALKVSFNLSFDELENKLTSNYYEDTYNIRKAYSDKNYSKVISYIACLQSNHIKEIGSCENFKYGEEQYDIMMFNLYNKDLKIVSNNKKEIKNSKVNYNVLFDFVSSFEGFRSEAYFDGYHPNGSIRYSIGYGTVSFLGEVISKEEAKQRSIDEIANYVKKYNLESHQEEVQKAVLSFVYNIGGLRPYQIDMLKAKKYNDLASDFKLYIYQVKHRGTDKEEKIKLGGLEKRRNLEAKLLTNIKEI